MVSLWPWRSSDSSPAGFEKTLSALAAKILDSRSRLDKTRARARRAKVLSTLYLGFAYVVYAVVVALVVGRRRMGPWEWSGLGGGPAVIYLVRKAIAAIAGYRLAVLERRLREHEAERASTIKKLKEATRYESTQQLLEKYGGGGGGDPEPGPDTAHHSHGGPTDESADRAHQRHSPGAAASPSDRTGLSPPPTANIIRSSPPRHLSAPQEQLHPQHHQLHPPSLSRPGSSASSLGVGGPDLAALSLARGPAVRFEPPFAAGAAGASPPRWYDRILDLLMGEDETSPKNRIVLICGRCRLVNGQAPPGTRRLGDLGRWRCMSCGAANGEAAAPEEDGDGTSERAEEAAEPESEMVEIKIEEDDDEVYAGATAGATASEGLRRRPVEGH